LQLFGVLLVYQEFNLRSKLILVNLSLVLDPSYLVFKVICDDLKPIDFVVELLYLLLLG
jgi:hypothetical protein